jgi:hypothetical protein
MVTSSGVMSSGRTQSKIYPFRAAFQSVDYERFTAESRSDGELRSWALNNVDTQYINMLALGDMDVHVGTLVSPASTGSVTYYFPTRPKGIMFFSDFTLPGSEEAHTYLSSLLHIGFYDMTNISSMSTWDEYNMSDSDNGRMSSTTKFVNQYYDNVAWLVGNITATTANSITVNWTTIPGAELNIHYITFAACQAKVGMLSAPAGTGTSATTGIGFTPKALILCSVGTTANDSHTTDTVFGLGFASGTSARGTSAFSQSDNLATSSVKRLADTDEVLAMMNGGGTKTLEADLSSFDSDGFTLNYTTTTSGMQIAYIALGDVLPSPGAHVGLHPIGQGAI